MIILTILSSIQTVFLGLLVLAMYFGGGEEQPPAGV